MTEIDERSTTARSRYLEGNYAPVTEEVTVWDLPVDGELPTELTGRYLRNGPNPISAVNPAHHHWFVGDGMVHGLRLRDGRAEWYRNRYVGSTRVADALGTPDIDGPNWTGSGIGPNTNVIGFAGTTWALVEAGSTPVELGYELDSIARNDFHGTLPGAFTAHPKFDPDTGEMHAMVYAWAQWLDHVQYVIVGTDGRVRTAVDIELPGMTMLHDMSLTSRYAVLYDQPVTVDIDLAIAGRFPFRWNPDYGNRVGLVPRTAVEAGDSGARLAQQIVWIEMPLCYSYHPLNAYDDADGSVVIDLCVYDSMFDRELRGPFETAMARLERWVLNPVAKTSSVTVIDASSNEFPRLPNALNTKAHRYGYTVAPAIDEQAGWATLKHDLVTGDRHAFDHGAGRCAGEAVFVPRAAHGDAEDDGWLLTLVHDLGAASTDFVVIDAADFDRGYVARIALPQRVPFGFHGNWVSDRTTPPPDSVF